MNENGNGLSAADVAAVVDNNRGGYGWGYPMVPAYPMAGGYGGGNWGGNLGGDWLILFLFAAMFGGFGGGWGGMGGMGNMMMWPWLMTQNTDNIVQGGFNQSATASSLAGIQTAITTGFSNAEVSACNRAMDAMQTAYNNQIAGMNQSFAQAQALDSRLDAISTNQQTCCCENRAAVADLKYTIATEAAANRAAGTANTQAILDKLCDQELQAERRENDQLRQQLNMANLAASQNAQTARILADNAAQTQQIENYVRPQINPAYIVPNPYAYNFYPNNGWGSNCGCNTGCGCGAA